MIHNGHRERLRNKAEEYGFSCLEDHEKLELMLGYSIPRRNTNEIAHELINYAGSLRGVFDMEMSELKKIGGVGNYTAFMIKLIGNIMNCPKTPPKNRYDMSRFSYVKEYISMLFAGSEKEEIYAIYLDKKMNLIECVKVASGNEWQAVAYPKDVFRPAMLNGAASFILTHNHPGGSTKPSRDDISYTVNMEAASNAVRLTMLEHIIYAEGECYPIMKGSKINLANSIEYDEV